ncbi:ATP-binding cassette domain-containing protein [Paenibacillus cremeus]|uniref:ATP-binding cassette domain-containing protein n=1 Tax=Paenibacillus cremeus TaxID=2163881 RepID=A0A559KEH0_9BACL|nr:ATP-binding cassette domain-containing protein [Paenibacillus cremeus]TVY10526.1 ATP-binding cassette domain-containing protein [Paenibacillus cremeus]
MIRINQLTIYPGNDSSLPPLLCDIETVFEPGTITLLVGRTGAGKSTLLQTLAGLLPLGAGSIRYDDLPLWSPDGHIAEAVLHRLGITFQYPERQLFAESVRKELAYSLRPLRLSAEASERAALEAIHQLRLPPELLDEPVLTLSEGTKRKVAIAGTLAAKPEWLLLDEPTAGMDPGSIELLKELLLAHRARGGGIVVASHDLDALLPLADRVLMLKHGTVLADWTPGPRDHELPELLLRAGVGWPSSIQIHAALQEAGMELSGSTFTPEETAGAIAEQLVQAAAAGRKASAASAIKTSLQSHEQWESSLQAQPRKQESRAERMNPLAKWLFYMLVSAGILMQDAPFGLSLASVVTVLTILLSGVPIRRVGRGIRFFLVFIVISSVIAGLGVEARDPAVPLMLSFSLDSALVTAKQLSRFLLLMALSVVFIATTSERRMQRGLEQAFSRLERFHVPVSLITFTAALMLRFVHLLSREVERLSLITQARGKIRVKPGTIRLRDLPVFLIPLLLSMMKQAEDMTYALEARGYRVKFRGTSTTFERMPFDRLDKLITASGVLLLIVLYIIHRFGL